MYHMYSCMWQCTICTVVCDNVPYVQLYVTMYHMYSCMWQCTICTVVCDNVPYVQLYVSMYHMYNCMCQCTICTIVCVNVPYVQLYMSMYHMYSCMWQCTICTVVCDNVPYVQLYMTMYHMYRGMWQCTICTEVCDNVPYVQLYVTMYHMYSCMWQCTICTVIHGDEFRSHQQYNRACLQARPRPPPPIVSNAPQPWSTKPWAAWSMLHQRKAPWCLPPERLEGTVTSSRSPTPTLTLAGIPSSPPICLWNQTPEITLSASCPEAFKTTTGTWLEPQTHIRITNGRHHPVGIVALYRDYQITHETRRRREGQHTDKWIVFR